MIPETEYTTVLVLYLHSELHNRAVCYGRFPHRRGQSLQTPLSRKVRLFDSLASTMANNLAEKDRYPQIHISELEQRKFRKPAAVALVRTLGRSPDDDML